MTLVSGPNFNCTCCGEYTTADQERWELRNLAWVCTPCASLIQVMHKAGEVRTTLAYAYMTQPTRITNGFDL